MNEAQKEIIKEEISFLNKDVIRYQIEKKNTKKHSQEVETKITELELKIKMLSVELEE